MTIHNHGVFDRVDDIRVVAVALLVRKAKQEESFDDALLNATWI